MDIFSSLKQRGIYFNTQQQEAVLDEAQHLLLLAVPGSGKTTVMVSRIARLIAQKEIPPEHILTMTFSRESAQDMARRFCALFPELSAPQFSTIHSFCYQVLRNYAVAYHRRLPQNIESNNCQFKKTALLRNIYNSLNQDFIGDDALETLETEISLIKNRMIQPDDFKNYRFETPGLKKICKEYEQFKKEHHLMDFDDMLSLCLKIFDYCPALLENCQKRFPYIHVDEAQDTSLLQHKIIEHLACSNSLFMVGDEDQSIYAFRGACPEALLSFSETYSNSKILKMEQNFRSTYEIVEKANCFIKQNQSRYDKNMFCTKNPDDNIYDLELKDYSDQYRQVLQLISQFPPNETTAILYRNNESAIPVIDLFDQKGIPFYVKEHRGSFFRHFIVRDILSFFRLSKNPNDIQAFRNIYFKLYLSKKVYQYTEQHITEYDNIFDLVLTLPLLTNSVAARIRDVRNRIPKLSSMKPLRAIQYIEDALGYGEFINSCSESGFVVESLYQKLNILKAIATGYPSVDAFIDRLEELERRISESRNKSGQHITLSTIHSSKGLEFDNVIILDLIEGLFPSADAIKDKSSGNCIAYEEEVRLFYVAVTRAKKRLFLMEAHQINGCKTYPSRFISHILGEAPTESPCMEGQKIYHTTYKKGIIIRLEEDTVTAEFELFGQKSFSWSYCLEHGILRIE